MRLKLLFLLILSVFISACVQAPQSGTSQCNRSTDPNRKLKIGFSMDTLKEERWVRDKDAFEAHCKKLGIECPVTVANNLADKQASDVDGLLTQCVDALVIAPHDAKQAATPINAPSSAKTFKTLSRVLTPESRAASAFPPIA